MMRWKLNQIHTALSILSLPQEITAMISARDYSSSLFIVLFFEFWS